MARASIILAAVLQTSLIIGALDAAAVKPTHEESQVCAPASPCRAPTCADSDTDAACSRTKPAIARSEKSAPCAISADVLVRRNGSNVVMIDVRDASARAKVWLPGAVGLNITDVPISPLVVSAAEAVLFSDGTDDPRMLGYCADLRKRGLSNVRTLTGGLNAWVRAGGTVAGVTGGLERGVVLEPKQLDAFLKTKGVLSVFTGKPPTSALARRLMKRSLSRGVTEQPNAFLRRSHAAWKSPGTLWVVFGQERDMAAWRAAAREQHRTDPLFFNEDFSVYEAWRQQQTAIAVHADQTPPLSCEQG